MTETSKIIFTGGGGLLGSEFRKIRPDINYPSSKEFNITNYAQMKEYVEKYSNPMREVSANWSIDDIIEPGETRPVLIKSLELLKGKKQIRPDRKHGNIPL